MMNFNWQIQSQLQKNNLKSGLQLITIKANSNINYMRSELNKSKQLIEQFQDTVKKAKDRGKEECLEKYDKLKITIEKDTETKVMQLLLYCPNSYPYNYKIFITSYVLQTM